MGRGATRRVVEGLARRLTRIPVTPAKAGVQTDSELDAGLRRHDER